jgi:DNA polymerase-1
MKKLILLDANHLMHRAYWAIQRNLQTSKGEQTNAVFGVASMLITLIAREKPDILVACFDEGDETFRHADHKDYKAGRAETPDDFYTQIPRVHQCLHAFGIPVLSDPKFEADDLLGTLAKRGVKEGYAVMIVTGDRDLFQMASPGIQIAIPHKGYALPEYLDAKGVEGKLGVTPDQVPDYKGLTGDTSDNLKGVRGIGPKTAVELLQKYHSLEGVYEHLPEMRESVRKKLEADRESAFFCKKLARLVTDVPLTFELTDMEKWGEKSGRVDAFFQEIEFFTLRRRFHKFLEENGYAHAHFSNGGGSDPGGAFLEEAPQGEKGKMTEEQLPLLD